MWIEILLLLLVLFLILYGYVTQHFGRWKKLGLPYVQGSFPFGSFNFLSKKHADIQSEEFYQEHKNDKIFGCFFFGKPMVVVNDADLMRTIQVKDFDHFVDRFSGDLNDKLIRGGDLDKLWQNQLTSLTGDKWKDVRGTFSPIFTSGKMKNMLKFTLHVADHLVKECGKYAEKKEEFELKSVFGKFSLDSIASTAFGIDAESFTNEKSVFVKHAARIFQTKPLDMFWLTMRMIPGVPALLEFFKINTTAPAATKFFWETILASIKLRRQSGERKNDLIDLMLDAIKEEQQEEEMMDEDQYENDMKLNHKRRKQVDEMSIVSTAMVLLVAGYDTTAISLSWLVYQLANHPEIQSKLQEEIDQAFEDAGDKFPDYNVIQSLTYLDMVLYESLRFSPPVGMNFRTATKDWKFPNSNIVLKEGDSIMYNARAFHRMPEHWSHPDEFYPEHFSKEEKSQRNP